MTAGKFAHVSGFMDKLADNPVDVGIAILTLIPLALMALGIVDSAPGPFATVAVILVPALLAAIMLFRRRSFGWLWTVGFALVAISPNFICFLLYPGWYEYGWHNLMQLDVIYSTIAGKDLLYYDYNEPLSYPYFGLLPLSLISQLLNVSPVLFYQALNVICFIAWFGIYQRYVLAESGRRVDALAAVALVFLFSGLACFICFEASLLSETVSIKIAHGFAMLADETRVSPIIGKFLYVDAMVVGLPSLAFQYFFSLRRDGLGWLLGLLFGLQTILSYPLLGPVSLLVPFAAALCRPGQRVANLVTLVALAVALFLTIHAVAPADAGSGLLLQSLRSMPRHVLGAFVICAPFLLPILYRSYRRASLADTAEPLIVFLCSWGAFTLFELPGGVQYKFLFGAMVVLAFEAAREIAFQLSRVKSNRIALILVLVIVGVVIATRQESSRHRPPRAGYHPQVDTSGFYVSSRESREMSAFLGEAGVAPSAGLIIANADFQPSVLLRMPLYINLYDKLIIGYGMEYSYINLAVKRRNQTEFDGRRRVSKAILVDHDYGRAAQIKKASNVGHLVLISDANLPGCPGPARRFAGGATATSPASDHFVCIL